MNLISKQRPSTVLGLSLDGNRLEAVVLRRSGNSLQTRESVAAALTLSPLGGDPLLVGREIRNLLDQAGIRERRCAVCIPANWILSLQVQLPELAEEDVESFLQLEAERGFPSGSESLYIVKSRSKSASGEQFATLIGIQNNHLETLEKALKAAQLKPQTFVLGLAALEDGAREGAHSGFVLSVGSNTVEVAGISGKGFVALRSLDGAVETSGAQKLIDADLVARELRITLGQLPASLAEDMRTVKVFARGDHARQFLGDFGPRLQNMGLRLETMDRASAAEFSSTLPPELALSPALAAAANFVLALPSGPNLLPPKINPIQAWMGKRAVTKKLGWVGLSAVGGVACIAGLFIYQQVEIKGVQAKLTTLDQRAKIAKEAQRQARKYNAWFDSSYRGLNIMKTMAETIPQSQSITAKMVRINNLSDVSCAGVALTRDAITSSLDNLRKAPGVKPASVVCPSMSGNSPNIQFTLNFEWEGDNNGN